MRTAIHLLLPALAAVLVLAACASTQRVPYPAFVQAMELRDSFLAGLPQLRAKTLSSDAESGRYSALLTLPAEWRWTTGASPGMSVEIYVLSGQVELGELTLHPGNYAYLPPGSLGLSMSTEAGAELLYFLDEADRSATIRTPVFTSREVIPWQPLAVDPPVAGSEEKVLRHDPGNGARTWLQRTAPGDSLPWQHSSAIEEGFLLSGGYRHSECVDGKAVTGGYSPGGYFLRPAGVVNGGPRAGTSEGAVWLLRRPARGTVTPADGCGQAAPDGGW